MKDFFKAPIFYSSFNYFSLKHITVLFLMIIVIIIMFLFRKKLKKFDKIIRYSFASILILLFIILLIWDIITKTYPIKNILPLELCDISSILVTLLLLTNSYIIFESIFFFAIGGSFFALITPDIANLPVCSFFFFQFFLEHTIIIIALSYFVFIRNFDLKLFSIIKNIILANIILVIVLCFDIIFDVNYMFLRFKPSNASILDIMGQWPWYILTAEILGVIVAFLLYIPFGIFHLRKRKKS